MRTWFRKPVLYPLTYEAARRTVEEVSARALATHMKAEIERIIAASKKYEP
jgi:hypothetical protein